ncbi:MAG: glycosyltransferase [Thermoanaerobaculia bacterium]
MKSQLDQLERSMDARTRLPGEESRPHVVHIVGTLGAGGVQRLVLGLAAAPALASYRHSVVCLMGATGNLTTRFAGAGIPVTSCSVPWPDTMNLGSYRVSRWVRHRLAFTFPLRLATVLRRLRTDLVHTHLSSEVSRQARGIVRVARLPWVWTIHNDHKPEGAELEDWRRAARIGAGAPSAITVVADWIAHDLRERGLDPPGGIQTTRGGVDIGRFRVPLPRDPGWRQELGIPEEAVVMGAAGRLVEQKGYDLLLRATARVLGGGVPLHLVMAGAGPLREQLAEETGRLGIGSYVHWVGFQENVPRFLRQLDVFLLPSRFEGFPIAMVEALASGLPCIATPVGGVREMVGDDGALVVPPESEEALAEAMRQMLSPAIRASYAARGPEIAGGFSIDLMAEQLSSLYGRLLAAARPEKTQRKVNER